MGSPGYLGLFARWGRLAQHDKSFKCLGGGLERITPEKAVQRPVSYNWNMSIHISRLAIEAGDSMPLLLAQLYELIYSIRSLQDVEPLFGTSLGG